MMHPNLFRQRQRCRHQTWPINLCQGLWNIQICLLVRCRYLTKPLQLTDFPYHETEAYNNYMTVHSVLEGYRYVRGCNKVYLVPLPT